MRLIASRQTAAEDKSTRAAFKPHQEVVKVMREDPGASRRQLIERVKGSITATDDSRRLEDSRKLSVQGYIPHRLDNRASSIWAQTLWELPERVMIFALNAVKDTLTHNANLHLWRKLSSPNCPLCSNRQTLLHTLNHCPVALQCRCYNQRHDAVLELLSSRAITPAPNNRSQWTSLTSHIASLPPSAVPTANQTWSFGTRT